MACGGGSLFRDEYIAIFPTSQELQTIGVPDYRMAGGFVRRTLVVNAALSIDNEALLY